MNLRERKPDHEADRDEHGERSQESRPGQALVQPRHQGEEEERLEVEAVPLDREVRGEPRAEEPDLEQEPEKRGERDGDEGPRRRGRSRLRTDCEPDQDDEGAQRKDADLERQARQVVDRNPYAVQQRVVRRRARPGRGRDRSRGSRGSRRRRGRGRRDRPAPPIAPSVLGRASTRSCRRSSRDRALR